MSDSVQEEIDRYLISLVTEDMTFMEVEKIRQRIEMIRQLANE